MNQAIKKILYVFDGFLPSNKKKPTEDYKNRKDFYSFSEVEHLKEFSGMLKDDFIIIDVDDPVQANILFKIIQDKNINCIVQQTTNGKHYIFKCTSNIRSCKDGYAAIGLKCEWKVSGTTKHPSPIKINGVYRKFLKICSLDEMDMLPSWLFYIGKKDPELFGMVEGDSRNQALFNHILSLQSIGLIQGEIKTALEIINQYIFKDPLDKKELEVIYRDEAFRKISFMEGKKFKPAKMAEYLQRQYYVSIIEDNLYIYKDGAYVTENNNRAIHRTMSKEYIDIKKNEAAEVIYKLEVTSPIKEISKEPKIIFKNGLYNIENKLLEPFNENYIRLNKIPWNYNPAAYDPELDQALNEITCNDKYIRAVIEEMFGSCLYVNIDNRFNKIFMFTGGNILESGSNGKSTILGLLCNMLGKDNISNLSLSDLPTQFKPIQLQNKLANIGDDIDKDDIDSTGLLKKLVTGEWFNAEAKGKDGKDIKNYANLIFSANSVPKINDFTYAMKRRLMFIPFEATFISGKNEKKYIKQKAETGDTSYIEYMIKLAVDGLHRLINNDDYTKSNKIDKIMKNFEEYNNPVLSFLMSEYENYDELLYENDSENDTKNVFTRFSAWCYECNIKNKLDRKQFTAQVNKLTGFITKQKKETENGKRISKYIWIKK